MALDMPKSSESTVIQVDLESIVAEKPSSSLLSFGALNNHQFSKIDQDAFSATSKVGDNSNKKTDSSPFRPPEYNYIQKLASLTPRFLVDGEKSDNDKYPRKMTMNRACEIFESFENKLDKWNQLESKIRLRVLRKVFEKYAQNDLNCVQCPHCSRQYTSAQGLYYHLEKCGLGVQNQTKKRCLKCGKQINAREFDIHMVIDHDATTDLCTAAITAECSGTEEESTSILSVSNACKISPLINDTVSVGEIWPIC
uniref:C2H2-type domain-containing protein n=1 Tax=Romanomermis culicivorax TaxID=13658 RepID=A0A915IUR0_ROMCU